MKKTKQKSKSGQNTAEYLIMLVLIAAGSISLFTFFGKSVRDQLNNVIVAFTGSDATKAIDTSTHGEKSFDIADSEFGMGNSDEFTYKTGNAE